MESVSALTALLPHVTVTVHSSKVERQRTLMSAIDAIVGLLSGGSRVNPQMLDSLLLPLLPYIPEDDTGAPWFREIASLLGTIPKLGQRENAVARLMPYLSDEDRLGVIDLVLESAVATNMYSVSGDQGQETLEMLAPYLSGERRDRVLAIVRSMPQSGYRAVALAAIGSYLPEPQRRAVFHEALIALQSSIREEDRHSFLADLLPYLFKRGYKEVALSLARGVPDKYWRARILHRLAGECDGNNGGDGDDGGDDSNGAERSGLLSEALATARMVEQPGHWVDVLKLLLPDLPEHERVVVRGEVEGYYRDRLEKATRAGEYLHVVTELLPYWTDQDLEANASRMMDLLFRHEAAGQRHEYLERFAPYLARISKSVLYPIWNSALHGLSLVQRGECLLQMGALAPVVEALGGQEAVSALSQEVLTATSQWA